MPPRSKVARLPPAVKEWLESALLENNFSSYELLAAELRARGYEISKSGLQRFGADFEERIRALKVATEQAKVVVREMPDDEGATNEALLMLTRSKLFEVMLEMEVDPQKVDLAKVTRSIADLAKASIAQKQHALQVRAKAEAAADAVEKVARQGGLSAKTVDDIRRHILGIAQ
ncbi:DUF3486 family protein [Cupriavidus metallidurans]|uniref:DUF3486 family protein n=1 Tax=Cupriavidus metallidurans TaxID=119219 RepID=A0A482INS8_9BURK|nr:DUF3486 family protein [Cupriavidus metallidurans]QBP09841.1 DUF3486 family protein [Cupriavidus metallidurans]